MFTRMSPIEMRKMVLDAFQGHSRVPIAGGDLEERVRIDDGHVVAYCYRAANLFAMWMIEVGLVQLYDEQGNMLQTLEVINPSIRRRQAA